MTTRRDFMAGTAAFAGAAFVGCGLLGDGHAHAQGAPRRREVLVAGKRVKTIDVHAHCIFPELLDMVGQKLQVPSLVMAESRIADMDAQGIDMEALSINPFWYKADRDVAEKLIKLQNEKLAELVARKPDRFVAFTTVALQHPELAVQQLVHGVKTLGLRGMSAGCAVDGLELANRKFHPVWAKAEELGVLIFLHPDGTPEAAKRFAGNGGLGNTIGNPLETTIALSHLIFEGTLDKFPGLKICSAHGGGYLPSYAARSDAICATFPDRCAAVPLKKKPTEYLRQLYYDSLIFTPEALRHLIAEVGVDRIMLGTDYPYPWTKTAVDHIFATPGLSDADRVAMLGETAARLLGIK